MPGTTSPRARKGLFAKMSHSLLSAAKRLNPASGGRLYRPEKHYMRGAGPKSRPATHATGGHTPETT